MASISKHIILGGGRTAAVPDEVSAFWWEGLRLGELRLERCDDCGHVQHPPHGCCGDCGSHAVGWVCSRGRGHVHSYVVCHYPRFPGYSYPYVVVLADLEEGVRVCAEYRGPGVGCDIGDPVALTFAATSDDRVLPVWVPGDELNQYSGAARHKHPAIVRCNAP